jgi:putative ABC transport system ATP-binding protein
MLRAVGLVKSYRAPTGKPIRVLGGVDLTVKGGELVVVTGPSGSGKSTLLNVLGLLEDGDSGEIWFEDARVSGLGRAAKSQARGRYVGFLFQSFMLLPSLTALENVMLAARYVRRTGGATRRRAMDLLHEVGVGDRMDHFPAQLSGGEQQRVAVARALIHKPAVVWADEPTGNLDSEVTNVIIELLVRMNKTGQTIVLVTHNPQVSERAQRTVRMRDGRIEATQKLVGALT